MKSDLIISKYKTENIIGTKSSVDPKTFFGSKMVDIEDFISINNDTIRSVRLKNGGAEITGSISNITDAMGN